MISPTIELGQKRYALASLEVVRYLQVRKRMVVPAGQAVRHSFFLSLEISILVVYANLAAQHLIDTALRVISKMLPCLLNSLWC